MYKLEKHEIKRGQLYKDGGQTEPAPYYTGNLPVPVEI